MAKCVWECGKMCGTRASGSCMCCMMSCLTQRMAFCPVVMPIVDMFDLPVGVPLSFVYIFFLF